MDYFKHRAFENTAWIHILFRILGYILCNELRIHYFLCDSLVFLTTLSLVIVNLWLSLQLLLPLGLSKLKPGNSIMTNSAAETHKKFLKIEILQYLLEVLHFLLC